MGFEQLLKKSYFNNIDNMKVGREFHFDSAHSIEGRKKCGRIHGHTYRLEIVVEGDLAENDMVIDFGELKEIVNENIINKLDHQILDDIVDNPTAESISNWIYNRLKKSFEDRDVNISSVKLWEGKNKWVKKD